MQTPNGLIHPHGPFIRNAERIPNTNDLWLAEATRAKTGRGKYSLVLLGPGTEIVEVSDSYQITLEAQGLYAVRGRLREMLVGNRRGQWEAEVFSPTRDGVHQAWSYRQTGAGRADDRATALRLLVVLAKELVLDR